MAAITSKSTSKPIYTIQASSEKSRDYTHWKCYHCGWYNWKSKLTCKCGRRDNNGLIVKLKLFVQTGKEKKEVKDIDVLRDEEIVNSANVDFGMDGIY